MNVAYNLFLGLITVVCIMLAAILHWHGKAEWGWFLFVGFLAMAGMVVKNKDVE